LVSALNRTADGKKMTLFLILILIAYIECGILIPPHKGDELGDGTVIEWDW
jgi:hypothetical protein